jgi:hypothetical protein
MHTTFHINANELNSKFLNALKMIFKSKRIAITIEEEQDETEYLLSSLANRKLLEKSLKNADAGKLVEVNIDKYLRKK